MGTGDGRIFVSYRREDSAHVAGRLTDRLIERFGVGKVFIDVDSLEPGVDFTESIERAVEACNVLLAVIGGKWADVKDERGKRRLEDPSDFVVLEIRAALERGVRVIPVLVDDARMPRRDDLPPALERLSRRHAVRVHHESFRRDTGRLIKVIDETISNMVQPAKQADGRRGNLGEANEDPPPGTGHSAPSAKEQPNHSPTDVSASGGADNLPLEEARPLIPGVVHDQPAHRRRLVAAIIAALLLIGLVMLIPKLIRSGNSPQSPRASASSPELPTILENGYGVRSVAYSRPDGKILASNYGSQIRLSEPPLPSAPVKELTGHTDWVNSLAFSPDGSILASGSNDKSVRLWNVADGRLLYKLTGHTNTVRSVAFSPDGTTVASGSEDGTVRLWNVNDGRPVGEPLRGHRSKVTSVAFSRNGKILASGGGNETFTGPSGDTTIRLWDVTSRALIGEPLQGHTLTVGTLAFSPRDDNILASGSWDRTIRLWNIADRHPRSTSLTGHTNLIRTVAFSPDGKTLASAGGDREVWLWDIGSKRPLRAPLRGHTNEIYSVAFSPGGKIVASGSEDGTVRLWNVTG
jgi:WD40 repeat protein